MKTRSQDMQGRAARPSRRTRLLGIAAWALAAGWGPAVAAPAVPAVAAATAASNPDVVAASSSAAAAASPPAEVHGALDAYAGHGVAMAWGVLRGKDEVSTMVVVRVGADAARYRALEVVGIDPFTKQGAPMAARVSLDGASVLVRIPRARFAELPQTEWRFLREGARPGEGGLVVFYRGVPDTTPEFDDEAKLEASLVERIARARRASAD